MSCSKCGKAGTKLFACSKCHVSCYCSKDCQAAAWTSGHKAACKELRARADVAAVQKLHHSKVGKSAHATQCAVCSKRVSVAERVPCVCTAVVFCSRQCRDQPGAQSRHQCPGPPSQVTIKDAYRHVGQLKQSQPALIAGVEREVQRQVNSQLPAKVLSGMRREAPFFFDLQRHADLGNSASAYLVGTMCSQRTSMNPKDKWLEVDAHGQADPKSVLSTDFLAVKYFRVGAEAGIFQSMLSLALRLQLGKGAKADKREAATWAWRALKGGAADSASARALLDDELCVLPKEVLAHGTVLHQTLVEGKNPSLLERLRQAPIGFAGPNLATLVMARREHCELVAGDFKVPSALGAFVHPRVDVVGAAEMRWCHALCARADALSPGASRSAFQYARFGAVPSATALSHRGITRGVENPRFLAARRQVGGDVADAPKAFKAWAFAVRAAVGTGLPSANLAVLCVHCLDPNTGTETLTKHKQHEPRVVCPACLASASERLAAAALGAWAASELGNTTESQVVYRVQNNATAAGSGGGGGQLRTEDFKEYTRAEVESVLACLAADEQSAVLAHPCFVAQDPSLFWPTLTFFGSVRAGLEHVAPAVDWTARLGPRPPAAANSATAEATEVEECKWSLAPGVVPGLAYAKCGSAACGRLFPKHAPQKCSKCHRRSYCDRNCFKADWQQHKLECVPDTTAPAPAATAAAASCGTANRAAAAAAASTASGEKPLAPPPPGEDAVVDVNYRSGALVQCVHGGESCAACALDFRAANQIWHLWRHRPPGTAALGAGVVARVAKEFAAVNASQPGGGLANSPGGGALRSMEADLAAAVPDPRRKALLEANLKAALGTAGSSRQVGLKEASSAAGFACFACGAVPMWQAKAAAVLEVFLSAAVAWDAERDTSGLGGV